MTDPKKIMSDEEIYQEFWAEQWPGIDCPKDPDWRKDDYCILIQKARQAGRDEITGLGISKLETEELSAASRASGCLRMVKDLYLSVSAGVCTIEKLTQILVPIFKDQFNQFYEAGRAEGAAEQRERDAKIAELATEIWIVGNRYNKHEETRLVDINGVIAQAIRTQSAIEGSEVSEEKK